MQRYLFEADIDDIDRAIDFRKFYGNLDSNSKKQAFNASLIRFKVEVEANPTSQPRFLIESITSIQSEAYRYTGNQGLISAIKSSGLHPSDGTDDVYLSFNKYLNPSNAKPKLKLPDQNTARYRIEVETSDLANDVNIPYGRPANNPELNTYEAIVKDNPQWGDGSGTQFVTRQQFRVKRIVDLTGEEPDWINSN